MPTSFHPPLRLGLAAVASVAIVAVVVLLAFRSSGAPEPTPQAVVVASPAVAPEATLAVPQTIPARLPQPTPIHPTLVPGADHGGLFADGIVDLTKVSTATWKTYSNGKYGHSFMYPGDWVLTENDNSHLQGPQGQKASPVQAVSVTNPLAAQGRNVSGVNCEQAMCVGPPPNFAGFNLEIRTSACSMSGRLIGSGTISVAGKQGSRCVFESFNDKSRTAIIQFPYGTDMYVWIRLEKGRASGSAEQDVLETILSTVSLPAGTR